jgi:hypothetical protein
MLTKPIPAWNGVSQLSRCGRLGESFCAIASEGTATPMVTDIAAVLNKRTTLLIQED